MGKEEKAGFKADIPSDALNEALKSVEKYSEKIDDDSPLQVDPDDAGTDEQPLVKVEVEDVDESVELGDSEELASLKRELEKAREQAAEMKDRMYRVAADADNIRKRALKEREEGLRFGQEGLLRELLPVVDNLERTLEHVPERGDDPAFASLKQGVEMVLKQFIAILETYGVKSFDSEGEKFDPKLHEALSRTETTEAEPGTILNQMHRGFMLHDRLLRPALVVVACAPEAEGEQNQGQDNACDKVDDEDETEQAGPDPDESTDSSYDEGDV